MAGLSGDGPTLRAIRPSDAEQLFDVAMRAFEVTLPSQPDELATLRRRWVGRTEHLGRSDPHGGLVAEHKGVIVGVAQAIVRERLWGLSLLVVAQEHRGTGLGRLLLERSLAYGRELADGLILSSRDPVAVRGYCAAGFTLHPTMRASGRVRRARLPALGTAVREAAEQDLALTAAASRHVRGATHEPDLAESLRTGARLAVCGRRGFALFSGGEVRVLAATDEEAARSLLWWVLAHSEQEAEIGWITAEQPWAVDVAVRAGLDLAPEGPLFVRGHPGPLAPYLPSGAYL